MVQVLMIEDDRDLAAFMTDYLQLEGIHCDHAYTGTSGLRLATQHYYSLILLDVMLPYMDGLTVCEKLREQGVDTPVLMLTARDTLQDKLAGFQAGSDDYLVKPFALEELAMRIHSLAKRRLKHQPRTVLGDLVIDWQQHTVSRAQQPIALTPTGWKIISLLVKASPHPVAKHILEQNLWGESEQPETNSLKVHLYKLRKQLNRPFEKDILHNVVGKGVALRVDYEEN